MVNIQIPLRVLDPDVADRIAWVHTNVYVLAYHTSIIIVNFASPDCEISSPLMTKSLTSCAYIISHSAYQKRRSVILSRVVGHIAHALWHTVA